MAKLYLKFEAAVLKEFALAQDAITIGRLPDNMIHVDNLAVSGHHAKIYWDTDHYVLEDNNSLNGTFVNNQKVSKVTLKDGDEILIGKHTVQFKDEWHEDAPAEKTQAQKPMPVVPKLEATMVLDTKKAKEMMEKLAAATAAKAPAPAPAPPPPPAPSAVAAAPAHAAPPAPPKPAVPAPAPPAAPAPAAAPAGPAKDRIAVLTVMSGKTDQSQYMLSGKLNVVGKSDMATIKLKGWFAPKVAAVINKRDHKYLIAASEKNIKVKVNDAEIAGQHELQEGDVIEVAGVKMTFAYNE